MVQLLTPKNLQLLQDLLIRASSMYILPNKSNQSNESIGYAVFRIMQNNQVFQLEH